MGIDSGTLDATADLATEDKQQEILDAIQGSSSFPSTDVEGNGSSTVGTTAVVIAFTGTTKTILISAGDTNLGRIYIGKSDVASDGSNSITFLGAGESFEITYDDVTNPIYVVGSIADQEYVTGTAL
jgi:hypothetical protein